MIFNPKKLFICLFFFAIPLGPFAKNKTQLFSMEDLSILKTQKNFKEFLAHALDIRPSKRNKKWEEMVQNMATGHISSVLEKKQFSKDNFSFIEALLSWPTLKTDEFFLIKRNKFGVNYLKKCFKEEKNKKACTKKLQYFWYNHKDPEVGLKLGQIIQKMNLPIEAWPFYAKAASSRYSNFFCKNEFLQRALFKKLSLTLEKSDISEKNQIQAVNKLVHSNCWGPFLKLLRKSLFSDQQIYREQAFKILDIKKFISQKEKDSFLTFYVLKGPMVGQIFNQAWNTIKELGQSYTRRNQVLEKLKEMDPLPDDIFALTNLNKKKTLIEFLYQNIPEYFGIYSKICLSYLKGAKFRRGNPTLYCKEFFKASRNRPWPSLYDKIEYTQIMQKTKRGTL